MSFNFVKILKRMLRAETVGQAQPLLVVLHNPGVSSKVVVSVSVILDLGVLAHCVDLVLLQLTYATTQCWM